MVIEVYTKENEFVIQYKFRQVKHLNKIKILISLLQVCFGVLLLAMIAFAAPQNAAVLPGAWLYNGDQSRKPYYAIEEVNLKSMHRISKESCKMQ